MESTDEKKKKKRIIFPLGMLTIDRYCAYRVQDSQPDPKHSNLGMQASVQQWLEERYSTNLCNIYMYNLDSFLINKQNTKYTQLPFKTTNYKFLVGFTECKLMWISTWILIFYYFQFCAYKYIFSAMWLKAKDVMFCPKGPSELEAFALMSVLNVWGKSGAWTGWKVQDTKIF